MVIDSTLVLANGRAEESREPYMQMAKLNVLIGTWLVERQKSDNGGKSWTFYSAATVQVKPRMKGLLLEEFVLQAKNSSFNMGTYISYDQYQKVFRQAAVEDYWGLMDISEGKVEGDTLILINTESKTYYPMGEGRLRALKVRVELSSPSRMIFIDESYDEGKSWAPTFQLHYQLL